MIMASWWSLLSWGRDRPYNIIFVSFWSPYGRILQAFWAHLEIKNRPGGSLDALFVSEVDFLTSTHPILDAVAHPLARFFGNFYRYGTRSGFFHDFYIVCDWFQSFLNKQKLSFRCIGVAKSHFRGYSYRMRMQVNFGCSMRPVWHWFWATNAFRKRVGKPMLTSTLIKRGRSHLTTPPSP